MNENGGDGARDGRPARPLLDGRVALVSGASRGIGRAIAIDLARSGAAVAIGLRDPDDDGGVVEEIRSLGGTALPIAMDVRDLAQSRAAIDAVVAELGGLDILVNNAGGFIPAPAIEATEEDFETLWSFNVRSNYFISQHAAKHFSATGGGAIVSVSSQAGLVALPGESVYCVTKAAIIHMTRCLALEWGDLGIRVNAVAPTWIATEGVRRALDEVPGLREDVQERIAALHRVGTPEEVAATVTFLASPSASMITGQTIAIDGGWTLR